ncbi:hypothetical protein ACM66B_004915 [Microbotryomycetes sp. NB124-2]
MHLSSLTFLSAFATAAIAVPVESPGGARARADRAIMTECVNASACTRYHKYLDNAKRCVSRAATLTKQEKRACVCNEDLIGLQQCAQCIIGVTGAGTEAADMLRATVSALLLALAAAATTAVNGQADNEVSLIEGKCSESAACKDFAKFAFGCWEQAPGNEVPKDCLCQDNVIKSVNDCGSCVYSDPVQNQNDYKVFEELAVSVPEVCGPDKQLEFEISFGSQPSSSVTGDATSSVASDSSLTIQTSTPASQTATSSSTGGGNAASSAGSSVVSSAASQTATRSATADPAAPPPAETSQPGAAAGLAAKGQFVVIGMVAAFTVALL